MYRIFLTETIPTTSVGLFTNDVRVKWAKTIEITDISNTVGITAGWYIKFQGDIYNITSVVYNSLTHVYTLTVSGYPILGDYQNETFELYTSDATTNQVELDCDKLDMVTLFSVADISDISKRNDSMTKQVMFQGTNQNDRAFGSIFHLNRMSDGSFDNRIFWNTSALRPADCYVYEDSMLVLRGSMRITNTYVDGDGNTQYETVITGKFIDLKVALNDKLLTDIDMSDLQHRYNITNIINSWNTSTERYNGLTDTYSTSSFAMGSAYTYPRIDFGQIFKDDGKQSGATDADKNANTDLSKINVFNFRPAIFVKEYFDRIFRQTQYTYELRGSLSFLSQFDRLIIPNNQQALQSFQSGKQQTGTSTLTQDHTYLTQFNNNNSQIPIGNFSLNSTDLVSFNSDQYTHSGTPFNAIFYVNKSFSSDVSVKGHLNSITNPYSTPTQVAFQLVERPYVDYTTTDAHSPFNDIYSWTVVNQVAYTLAPNGSTGDSLSNLDMDFIVGQRQYKQTYQLMLRLWITNSNITDSHTFTGTVSFGSSSIAFPKDASTTITYEIQDGDVIIPTPPVNIKQLDFLKSIIGIFNLYVYNTKEKPNHLIFQKYDDYYAFVQPHLLTSNSLEWSKKIDLTKNFKIKYNLEIPKKYTFVYKTDSDYLNSTYQGKYVDPYGTFRLTDSLGVTDERKISLIFSPSPMTQDDTTGRFQPGIYTVQNNTPTRPNFQPVNSNIRLLYYNGLKNCESYDIQKDVYNQTGGYWGLSTLQAGLTQYPQCSNYYFDPTNADTLIPLADLNFGVPFETYFANSSTFINTPTAFDLYYSNQVTELKNENVFTIECNGFLTETDIGNLDLRQPVFVDLGRFGFSYFKVLEVQYTDNKSASLVTLQRIVLGKPEPVVNVIPPPGPADTNYGATDFISGDASTENELKHVQGAPGAVVTIKVTGYTNTNSNGRVQANFSDVYLNTTFTVTLDASGLGSFNAKVSGDASDHGLVMGQFTIINTSIGSVGSPDVYTISKVF